MGSQPRDVAGSLSASGGGTASGPPLPPRYRVRLTIRGAVQGVGFRPFVHRLAHEEALSGWVMNDASGVLIEVEGERSRVRRFGRRLLRETPPAAEVQEIAQEEIPAVGGHEFAIQASDASAAKSAIILPDLATCADCRRELEDPGDRRDGYPFTNCTHCGPRFTILEDLPYDRPRTTMRGFTMCPECLHEYEDPADRRFHAQPNACPVCGPQVCLVARDGTELARRAAAIRDAAAAIRAGRILALKGIGGYQLLVDARDGEAVGRLRMRKHRPSKPLALMVRDLEAAEALCEVEPAEAELLRSSQAPIVLLRSRPDNGIAAAVAPFHPTLGVMLPTTPLHHLLMAAIDRPVVATSGNLSDEPIATDDAEALARLGAIADLFLVHDRPIARHVDDSVAWIFEGRPQLVRRARGYAPLPVRLGEPGPTIVAVGAHQKDVAALAVERQVFLSQHIGDMETPEAHAAFERVLLDFIRVYDAEPVAIAHDLHPDYPTTRWAQAAAAAEGGLSSRCGHAPRPLRTIGVQHHHAHLASLLAERVAEGHLPSPCLGLTWDGTGYGPDGTVWGGEALVGDAAGFERVARLRPFRLPGGEIAVREPWRVALALLWQLDGDAALERAAAIAPRPLASSELDVLSHMLDTGLRSPETSSVGRLFDAVAALAGVAATASYEGEAAMRLEFQVEPRYAGGYPIALAETPAPDGLAPGQHARPVLLELDWRPLVHALLEDRRRDVPAKTLAARFHSGLADAALEIARRFDAPRIALTGGCFQNRTLTAAIARRARHDGREVLVHRVVPANDGGIALGQAAVARARLAAELSQEV